MVGGKTTKSLKTVAMMISEKIFPDVCPSRFKNEDATDADVDTAIDVLIEKAAEEVGLRFERRGKRTDITRRLKLTQLAEELGVDHGWDAPSIEEGDVGSPR